MEDRISINDIGLGDVDRILDESEYRGECGHWANTAGTRIYDLKRVRHAKTIQIVEGQYLHSDADQINQNPRPCTKPTLVVDYRYPLKQINESLDNKIWSCRLRHPKMVSQSGLNDRERNLVVEALSELISFIESQSKLQSIDDVDAWLIERSKSAMERLRPPWPDLICRKVVLRSYLPRGKSKRTVARMLDAFSLIHTEQVPCIFGMKSNPVKIFDVLVDCPVVRFDPIVKSM